MRLHWAMLLSLGLVACQATPVFESRPTYTPPIDAAGLQCVADCQAGRDQCQTTAATERGQCRIDVYPDLLAAYEQDLVAYKAAQEQHVRDLDRYRNERDIYEARWNTWQQRFSQCVEWRQDRLDWDIDRLERRIDRVRSGTAETDEERNALRAQISHLEDQRRRLKRDLRDVGDDCRLVHAEPQKPDRPESPVEPTRPGPPESDDPYAVCLSGEVTALGQCTDSYNQCYQTCGGVVGTEQICVENCEGS